jgi:hypothetical protein
MNQEKKTNVDEGRDIEGSGLFPVAGLLLPESASDHSFSMV